MKITYLLNSGFLVQEGRNLFIFDDFEDPANVVEPIINAGNFDNLYIFVSHAHFDHFGTHISTYADKVTRYIFSYDLRRTKRAKMFPQDKIILMNRYSDWQDDNIKVNAYDSTDIGLSFLVETPAHTKIFHAGDFNWWHWTGDTPENIKSADALFAKQMQRLEGIEADVAFFPVDGRLGECQEMGAKEFISKTNVKYLIAMHRVGYPRWQPSENFFESGKIIPTWSPVNPGESIEL